MPVTNKKGGKGHKRGKKISASTLSTVLTYKDTSQNQEYGRVIGTLGDCRLSIELCGVDPSSARYSRTTPMMAKIPGSFRKKIFINKGDYVLLAVRDFQQDYADIITKYSHSEAMTLMKQKEIPNLESANMHTGDGDDDGVEMISGQDNEFDTVPSAATSKNKDAWFKSLLPPNSDSDDSDQEDDASSVKRPLFKGLNPKSIDDLIPKQEIIAEEIDLETL